jgi:hypothetical protein
MRRHLLATTRTAGRPQDLADVAMLEGLDRPVTHQAKSARVPDFPTSPDHSARRGRIATPIAA